MFRNKVFNTKITIEKLNEKLSDDNRWISEYENWQETWASVSLKAITSKQALYLFIIKWKQDFPTKFRVKINEKIFMPTQPPIVNPANDTILFHAILVQ
ncbi:MAG: hypothetical protein IJ730_00685 [Alphaproteobacteria bacterium]|nr:hypothetical protein [Alphaproteobacteria bacterium]